MKRAFERVTGLFLALCLTLPSGALAAPVNGAEEAMADTAAYLQKTVDEPQVGSLGGEWVILGLARSGLEAPERYYQDYYARVEEAVTESKGVLHEKKYTEYSRVILALSAIGKDARQVAGYDLTLPLGDYEKTVWQGVNGPIWALLALDSVGYPMPETETAKTQATRQMYVDYLLDSQLADGGWALGGRTPSDPDVTGMAIQALAKYQDQTSVAKATEEALDCLSALQEEDGGYGSWETANAESAVQVLVAITELGLSPEDARFVKNGNTLLDNILSFYTPGKGFRHMSAGAGSDQMATEQAMYALAAVQRARAGKNSLYRMGDALAIPEAVVPGRGEGLAAKHEDVRPRPVVLEKAAFPDLTGHPALEAVEALAVRAIITGKPDGSFAPEADMTRAEFAAIVVKALGLPTGAVEGPFADVPASHWAAGVVNAAYSYGIVNGTGEGSFAPNGTISRQEAAVMVTRAAALCGLDTQREGAEVRDTLAPFLDYTTSAAWARPALAFCYDRGILDDSDMDIRPTQAIRRGEVAQMLYALLERANLL